MSRIRGFAGSVGRGLSDMGMAQREWDLACSRTLLFRRRGLLAFLVLTAVAPTLLWAAAEAGYLPEKVPILGGSKAIMPAAVNGTMFAGSILVGLIAGLITGVIGAGGGYILTPALMSFGVRGIMAVGTDQFHLFAKAIMGTTIHRKMGNVNFGLAAWFVAGSLGGVTLGGRLSRAIFQHSPALSDAVISSFYVVVLGFLGVYALGDWIRASRRRGEGDSDAATGLAHWLQAMPLKPRVRFDERSVPGGRSIPVYPVLLCGAIVGFVAAIMGVGGGFLTFPMFVYGLGVSTRTTVGTDILQIIFTTSSSSIFQYAIYGYVFYSISIGMLLGSLVGVQLGAVVTKVVKGSQIRAFYALTILAGFFNRVCALPRKLADLGYLPLSRGTSVLIEQIGTVLFFGIVGAFSLWILMTFARNAGRLRGDTGGRLVVNRGALARGTLGLAAFSLVLGLGMAPVFDGENGLQYADRFFNRLAKDSSNHIGKARAQAVKATGVKVDIGVNPREVADPAKMVKVLTGSGIEAGTADDGRVRVRGDLGVLMGACLDDAEEGYANRIAELGAKHGMEGEEVLYCWWLVFDGLTRRFVQENQGARANTAKFMTAKVLEPVYNFRGIEAAPIRGNVLPASCLLVFYVLYTLWYGFSIMSVFEGVGVSLKR